MLVRPRPGQQLTNIVLKDYQTSRHSRHPDRNGLDRRDEPLAAVIGLKELPDSPAFVGSEWPLVVGCFVVGHYYLLPFAACKID